ncbi:coiled-coil domain-containing protein 189 isoform X2 [Poeciliopsis prolifica]|uniref:coiled-coil domain-containing protein 189 isoform X2 n=1 Tax=Poeciliopsis prolifica TaxID=188132 RepID=UPI0024142295|nr:coiled-coil domain-containing protein 189 isoform X2 [Poeciliopsis prolifica]
MDANIKVPRDLKAKLLLWTDLSFHDMEVIEQARSVPDLERTLCSALTLDLPEPERGVLLELLVQTVLFCRQQGFNNAQTSALLSIIKSIHEANIETPLNNSEQCFKYCNDLLLCHSVRRPPFSVKLFSQEETHCVLNYIQDNYLRHDRLYKYIFTPQMKLDLFLTYSGKGGEGLAADEAAAGDDSSDTQKASAMEEETAEASVDLKALVEQEVREQMEQVSKQLDQRIKETASEQSGKAQSAKSAKSGKKGKK